jgi:hypothetical protein
MPPGIKGVTLLPLADGREIAACLISHPGHLLFFDLDPAPALRGGGSGGGGPRGEIGRVDLPDCRGESMNPHPTKLRTLLCCDGEGALWEVEVAPDGTGGKLTLAVEAREHRWIAIDLAPSGRVGYAVVMRSKEGSVGDGLFRVQMGSGGDELGRMDPEPILASPWMRGVIVDPRGQ